MTTDHRAIIRAGRQRRLAAHQAALAGPQAGRRAPRWTITAAQLVDALATGEPLGRIARRLDRHDRQSLLKLMARYGIERSISGAGVVTVIRRQAEAVR